MNQDKKAFVCLDPSAYNVLKSDFFPRDFKFIVDNVEYVVPKFIAFILSPKVVEECMNDPTCSEYKFETKVKGDFNIIIQLGYSQKIIVDKGNREFIRDCAEHLGCPELVSVTNKEVPLDPNTIMTCLMPFININYYEAPAFDKAASIFEEISKEKLVEFGIKGCIRLLSSPNLKIKDQRNILELIIYYSTIKGDECFELLPYLHTEFLSPEAMKIFTDFVEKVGLIEKIPLWDSIMRRLTLQPILEFEFTFNENSTIFEGVLAFFCRVSSNILTIKASSYNNELPMIFGNTTEVWDSLEKPNENIEITFNKGKFRAESIAIMSGKTKFLRSFDIEAYNNDSWISVAVFNNVKELNAEGGVCHFKISKCSYCTKYRIKSISRNWNGTFGCLINNVDLFGRYVSNEK